MITYIPKDGAQHKGCLSDEVGHTAAEADGVGFLILLTQKCQHYNIVIRLITARTKNHHFLFVSHFLEH